MKIVFNFIVVCLIGLFCYSNLLSAQPKPKDKVKAFSVECVKPVASGFYGVPSLELELGEETSCTLMLDAPVLGLKNYAANKVSTNLRTIDNETAVVMPEHGVTDGNGKFHFSVTAKGKGAEWVAWALPDSTGNFNFTRENYDSGIAFGMFVKVK